jgi:ribosomal protein S18 acetylase RimI-like enzyme
MTNVQEMFANPFWYSLATEHAGIAIGSDAARRFPLDVIPFAGFPASDEAGVIALRELLAPGELIYVTGKKLAPVPGLEETIDLPGWQMHIEAPTSESQNDHAPVIRELHAVDATAMVGLTDVAFPGYFRPRTYILGRYFGIEIDGQLVAMAGERLALPGYREISAVCTHPAHTGKGYAAVLIRHLMRVHADAGLRSFLHVTQTNERAIALYERLGYTKTRPIYFHGLRRA